MKKKITFRDIIFLQFVVIVFTISSIVAKFASGQEVMTFGFFLFYGLEVAVLGIYAILWQQVIKKFDLSIAYANKAMTLLWSLLWSVLIFRDSVTPAKVVGVLLVIAGTIILNSEVMDEKSEEDQTV